MVPRIDVGTASPGAKNALGSLVVFVNKSGLDASLVDLVQLRVSIINGCAYCIDAHTKDARFRGETEQRLYAVAAWEEAPFFSDRERAALAWTDIVCKNSETHVPDEAFTQARKYFTEKELVDLTMAIIVVNAWSTLASSFRFVVGNYSPTMVQKQLGEIKKSAVVQP